MRSRGAKARRKGPNAREGVKEKKKGTYVVLVNELLLRHVKECVEDDGNDEVERRHRAEQREGDGVDRRAERAAAVAEAVRVLLRGRAVRRLHHHVVHHDVPVLARRDAEQRVERAAEGAEVGVVAQRVAVLDVEEKLHAEHRVHEEEDHEQEPHVHQRRHRRLERPHERLHALRFAAELEQPSEPEDAEDPEHCGRQFNSTESNGRSK